MSTILITGASGFLGSALLKALSERHTLLTIGRNPMPVLPNHHHVRGMFSSFEDLCQLDGYSIDAVVHLAAVTGGCQERDGILVNVEGTRVLMRYLIDRGCKKFVNASSSAVCGFQSVKFRPAELPMGDEHPCLDRDGYGVSKYLMEEVTRYLCLQNPEIDVINLRLAAIFPDDNPPAKVKPCDLHQWAVGMISQMALSDALHVLQLAVESPMQTGVRIFNALSRRSWVEGPVVDVLRRWWGDSIDLSYFDNAPEDASLFDTRAIETALGFVAKS